MTISHQSKIRFTATGKPTIAIVGQREGKGDSIKYHLGFRNVVKSDGEERGKISYSKGKERLENLDVLITFESKDNIDAVIIALQALKEDDN